ncbi:MAG: TolC family protein [Balneolaceae bacterium]|nr:TolC family protein [Balneolaceae bacterium]|tara:strand:- start:2512 stop:3885 length:1374 start_codon:yes stop_codon:yes gene_type:complete
MLKQKIILVIIIGIVSTTLYAQSADLRIITIDQAISIALENNYSLKQAKNELDLAEDLIFSEKADFLPSVSASMNGSRTTGQQFIFERFSEDLDPFVDVSSQSISGGMNASINLFNGFNNILTLKSSQSNKESRAQQYERAKESVIFNTASRYLQVLLDKELLAIAEQNLETSTTQLNQVQAQVELGARPMVDLFNQEAQVANDELVVTQRENTLSLNSLLLVRQLEIDPLGSYDFIVPDLTLNDLPWMDINIRSLVSEALSTRSDILSAEATILSLKYQMQITKNSLLPSLRASAGVSSRYSDQYSIGGNEVSFSDQFFDQQVNRSLGLSFSLPLFNNWNRIYSIQSAEVQLKNAELNLDNSKMQVIQEVSQAYNDYSSYVKQLDASEKSLIASERAFQTQQERYNLGASTLIELTQAQSAFVSAQSSYTQALYNLIFQEKLLDFYLGKLKGDNIF